jgi:amino acid adenylation domain-containing protein
VTLGAYAHQDVPFEKLVEELEVERDLGHTPLFQVMMVLQNAPTQELELSGLKLRTETSEMRTAKFDLTLGMMETQAGIRGMIEYSTDLFDAETIKRLAQYFERLLESIATNADQKLSSIEILSDDERIQLIEGWNNTRSEYPREASIQELFAAQVERSPEAIALTCGDEQLSYRELDERSNRLAHYLQTLGIDAEHLVALCMERSIEMVVSLLAILKAGGAYLPLDPAYPQQRLSFMLADTEATVVLTSAHLCQRLPETQATVICLERAAQVIASYGAETVDSRAGAANLAYLMYTSGSTGTPKGILIPHRAITRLVRNSNYISLLPSDRVAQVSTCSFDAATFEIWGALLNGARLVIISKEVLLSPPELAAHLSAQGITAMFLTSALFNHLAHETPHAFSGLRHLLIGGEALDPGSVARVLKGGAPERLMNAYGPTESTTFATWQLVEEVSEETQTIPIGKPLSNTQTYILDEELQLVPVGVAGELYLGGDGLARGYLGRAELTAEKFIPHPYSERGGERLYNTGDWARYGADGAIDFLGRRDHQVKMRGYRIELGEIEAGLTGHESVREAVVIALDQGNGDKRLMAYVVAEQEAELSSSQLRDYLEEKLPAYMVPSAFVMLDALPLNSNNKTDRAALSALNGYLPELEKAYVAPQNEIERAIAAVWQEVLQIEKVGVHDNFFELGGNSLLIVRAHGKLQAVSSGKVSLVSMFQYPTVSSMAEYLSREENEQPSSPQADDRAETRLAARKRQRQLRKTHRAAE